MKNIYDVIIIWSGAAWLFCSIQADFWLKKLILEKNKTPWKKVLLSGWERANVSNIYIDPTRDYFGQNRKAMISLLSRFSQWDLQSFFAENWVEIVEEDRWRLILKSWDSRELLNLLLKKSKQNNTEIKYNSEVIKIKQVSLKETGLSFDGFDAGFVIITKFWENFYSKKVVITTWWKSFYQVWTTGDWYIWAKQFWHTIINPFRWLCGLVTRENLSEISWISLDLIVELFDKSKNKLIYKENWPFLFTHFGISWPIVFNTSVALWEYLNELEFDKEKYLKENIFIKLSFDLENIPKRVKKFFNLDENNSEIVLDLIDLRSWKESKVTGWGVKLDELNNNLESKLTPGLYFAWEILDLTGKTWWYNLQLAWSSGYVVW